MFAHVEALVRGVDHHRVLQKAVFLQVVQDPPHGVVHAPDDPQVILDIALELPGQQFLAGHLVPVPEQLFVLLFIGRQVNGLVLGVHPVDERLPEDRVGLLRRIHPAEGLQVVEHGHVLVDGHGLVVGGGAPGGVVIVKRLGFRELDVFVKVQILKLRHPVAVRGLVVDIQAEGLVLVPVFQEVDGVVGDEGGGVALDHLVASVGLRGFESGIVILSLVVQDFVEVEPARFAEHVPLPDDGGLVARLMEQFGHKGHRGIQDVAEHGLAVLVAVEAGHQAGAAGGGEGIFHIGPPEQDAFPGQAVQVGGRCLPGERVSVCADGLVGVVVRHDIDDVQPSVGRGLVPGASDKEREHHGGAHEEVAVVVVHIAVVIRVFWSGPRG